MLNMKQQEKDWIKYATEIENLTNSLKRAYTSEGVPVTVADTYSTNVAVMSLCKNASSEKSRLIMKAGRKTLKNDK